MKSKREVANISNLMFAGEVLYLILAAWPTFYFLFFSLNFFNFFFYLISEISSNRFETKIISSNRFESIKNRFQPILEQIWSQIGSKRFFMKSNRFDMISDIK